MNFNYTYKELPIREYKRTNLTTSETIIVTVTNRNNLFIKQHLHLLNLNDDEHFYSEIPNQDI